MQKSKEIEEKKNEKLQKRMSEKKGMNQVKKTRTRMKKEECENKNTRTINKKNNNNNNRKRKTIQEGESERLPGRLQQQQQQQRLQVAQGEAAGEEGNQGRITPTTNQQRHRGISGQVDR